MSKNSPQLLVWNQVLSNTSTTYRAKVVNPSLQETLTGSLLKAKTTSTQQQQVVKATLDRTQALTVVGVLKHNQQRNPEMAFFKK